MQYRPYSLSPNTYTTWLFGLLGTIVCVVAVVFLLARVLIAANSINDKAGDIKKLGGTINESTAAVLELGKTTDVAQKILDDAKPLAGQLNTTIGTASGISGLATSINNTAGQINTTAGQIQGTATTIDASAVSIDHSAQSINQRVGEINGKLDPALNLVSGVRGDTGAIRVTADKISTDATAINTRIP